VLHFELRAASALRKFCARVALVVPARGRSASPLGVIVRSRNACVRFKAVTV